MTLTIVTEAPTSIPTVITEDVSNATTEVEPVTQVVSTQPIMVSADSVATTWNR